MKSGLNFEPLITFVKVAACLCAIITVASVAVAVRQW